MQGRQHEREGKGAAHLEGLVLLLLDGLCELHALMQRQQQGQHLLLEVSQLLRLPFLPINDPLSPTPTLQHGDGAFAQTKEGKYGAISAAFDKVDVWRQAAGEGDLGSQGLEEHALVHDLGGALLP